MNSDTSNYVKLLPPRRLPRCVEHRIKVTRDKDFDAKRTKAGLARTNPCDCSRSR